MHKKAALLALALSMALCACAKTNQPDAAQQALSFRQEMLAGDCSFQAEITADFGDTVSRFSLSCAHTQESGTTMTITAPETLAGLIAEAGGEEVKLVFEDTEASFGTLSGLGLSPMAAPELMCRAWQSGYVQDSGMEEELAHVTYLCGYGEDELRVDTWFQAGVPVRAELFCDGRMAVQIDVTDFILRKAETDNESTQTNLGRYLAGQSGA